MIASFDAARASRYLEEGLMLFLGDPPDSEFQRGYLAALLATYTEGLGQGVGDDRLKLLDRMTEETRDG